MWFASLTRVLTVAVATASPPASGTGDSLPEPIFTRQTTFSIPFRVERGDPAATEPVGVQLQVSIDRGTTWHAYSKVDPGLGRFLFRAAGDGEYWFVVQTIDAQGRLRPPQPVAPGLRVIVDTKPPRMALEARRGEGGEIIARWRVEETNLQQESLKILYRSDPQQTWQAVAVDRDRATAKGPIWSGDVIWWPQPSGARYEIRAEVSDRAGNMDVSHAQVDVRESPPAGAGRVAAAPPTQWHQATGQAPLASQTNPAVGNQYRPSAAAEGAAEPTMPDGAKPRMVNTTMFELEYTIDAVGPSGIARVELWGTSDGGRTWSSFGRDEDKRSPMIVNVPGEGVFGFRVVVESGAGLGGNPPQSGAVPDVWIGVDTTCPEVHLISAEQSTGENATKVLISWQAHDRALAPQPVALFFSGNAGGPWTKIAADLENTGQYAWKVPLDVPEQIFIRIEVRDEAGNFGVAESSQPLQLDRHCPTVRIQEVRPIGPSAHTAPRRYHFLR